MKNKLICGDNLEALKTIESESVDLIYIDPPFFSNRHYEVIWGDEAEVRSFEDRWEGGINVYIEWMRPRVEELYRVLKSTGSFYLHCDWHANAYLRIMLDEIFGEKNFRNEVIWFKNSGGIGRRTFNKRHETLFFYSKTKSYFYDGKAVGDLREQNEGTFGGYFGTDEHGRKYREVRKGGRIYRYYMDEPKNPNDVWVVSQIPERDKTERLGYPTQKPEALLERVIKASSNKVDIVLDAFCGCGTTLVVAHKLGRNWIGIDISPTAVKVMEDRLKKVGAIKDNDYITTGMPTTVKELRELKPFEFQNWVIHEIGARQSRKKVGDMGLDGHFVKDLWHDEAGIQVKQSEGVGRNVIDNFETALKRKKYKKGYIVAFSFTKGAYEEVARLKNQEELEIKLIKVENLLYKKEPIL